MGRSNMFGDDEPEVNENPSPRTTIVGGRPPEKSDGEIPVPTGIQRLLRLASVDEDFRLELLKRRGAIAEPAGVALTPNEFAILAAIPEEQLSEMAKFMPPPPVDRRDFLRKTAATAVILLGGAALSDCSSSSSTVEPAPKRPDHRETELEGGIAPTEPPPDRNTERLAANKGGAEPDEPPPRPKRVPSPPGGARPDVPRPKPPKPDGGVEDDDTPFAEPPPGWDGGSRKEPAPDRPIEKRPTRGIRPGKPKKPKKLD